MEELKEQTLKDFPQLPECSYTLKDVPKALELSLSPAFYLTSPIDDSSQNVIYINRNPIYDNQPLYNTIAHEGYPGHLYQNVFFGATAPDKVRSLLSFPGYAEGYATYAEHLSYHYMGLDTDAASILQLSSSVTLGIYASLDLGIHYEGWSREQAENFLYKYGIQSSETAGEIYHAIVAEPTSYLKYYVGYMEFLTLRQKAEKQWGKDFTEKRFHQYILEMGDAPFSVLEKYLK